MISRRMTKHNPDKFPIPVAVNTASGFINYFVHVSPWYLGGLYNATQETSVPNRRARFYWYMSHAGSKNSDGNLAVIPKTTGMELKKWYFLTWLGNGNFYVNGNYFGQPRHNTGSADLTKEFFLGNHSFADQEDRAFIGYMKNFFIINGILSEAQIRTVYNAGHTVNTPVSIPGVNYLIHYSLSDYVNRGTRNTATIEASTNTVNTEHGTFFGNGALRISNYGTINTLNTTIGMWVYHMHFKGLILP